ncbi:MAG: zf-HC2 domain-containing protein [Ardenticatenia bacterium]|nr:MAG: zf-HC2 domain-containing protein [Ardenticatenia bacterium]
MTCEELLDYLSAYIDNELDEELTAEAQAHLASCHNCRVVLDTTQQTILLFRRQGTRRIPAIRRQRLFSQLEAAFREKDPRG